MVREAEAELGGVGGDAQANIQAVRRAARILELFGPQTAEISVAEAAERLGLNRSTTHRYFSSLLAAGFVERTATPGVFTPGALLLQIGAFAIGRRSIIQAAPPHMRALADETRVTTVMSLWGTSGPLVSHVEEDYAHSTVVTVRVGAQLTLDSRQAILFLAFLPDQLLVDRLLSTMPPTRRDQIRQLITTVRQTGMSVRPVNPRGVSIIAAPVFDRRGIAATLALVGTEHMLPADTTSREAGLLKRTAIDLSAEMGGQWLPDLSDEETG
jgi:DNA-binding IclR family transcriptional regulator